MGNEIKQLYGAWVKFPKVAGDVEFNYSKMEIKKIYPDMTETRYPYFTSRNVSTCYFEKNMLNKEYQITDELTIFYSDSKVDCMEWLENKRKTYLISAEYDYRRLKDSKILEIEEGDLF